jgi:anaerobic dimethyl sulfoxide reductase subunit B (iron-sulfur subunit)
MTKCDFCRDELKQEGVPACVAACPTRALQFGEYEELAAAHGADLLMAPLPPPRLTEPNLILEPHKDARPVQTRGGSICNPEEVKDA